ncbi:MAG: hypothetical protein IH859_04225, partial [Chloroflexi bacterium]|nr:hypothetical protein [Chloroflexota bacterium]
MFDLANGKESIIFQNTEGAKMHLDWSPNGDYLLFWTQKDAEYGIWTIKTDGSRQQLVLKDSIVVFSPRWSINGDAIYYLKENGSTKDLMKLKIDPAAGHVRGLPLKL